MLDTKVMAFEDAVGSLVDAGDRIHLAYSRAFDPRHAFLPAARTFLNNTTAFTGATAFSSRAIGNLSQPYFPGGIEGNPNGPFSVPIAKSALPASTIWQTSSGSPSFSTNSTSG